MAARTIAIGDIHGCASAFKAVLAAMVPAAKDQLIVLGDYVDRGPASRSVVDDLRTLANICQLTVLLGNHEEMLLAACSDEMELFGWLEYGGRETLASYGVTHPAQLPSDHLDFISAGGDFFESADHFLVHANYLPDVPLDQQPPAVLRWESLWQRIPTKHQNGKLAIVGHTAQHEGEIWDLGHLKCIDTYCHGGGWLTALELRTGQVWQADRAGRLRAPTICASRQDVPPG